MPKKTALFKILLSLSLAFAIIAIPVSFFLNFTPYYYLRFQSLGVYNNFQESENEVKDKFSEMINFINGRNHSLDNSFWSNEDKIHLSDVQKIVISFNFVLTINAIFLLFVYFKKYEKLITSLKAAFIGTGVIFLILLFIVIVNFDNSFIIFHKILFRNDYWMLDPVTSNLIRFFPQQIFFEIGLYIFIFAIITSILGYLWIPKRKKLSSQVDT